MARKLKSTDDDVIQTPGSPRVSVTFPSSTHKELGKIAKEKDISLAEAARRSVKRDLSLRKFEEKGGEVLVQFPDGRTVYIMPNE